VAGNALYRVRATEGWLTISELRGTKIAIPLAASGPTPQAPSPAPFRVSFGESGRRFGQRRE
jgi:hypothetical protein